MIYDYRNDVNNLIKKTSSNQKSLEQSLYALKALVHALEYGNYSIVEEISHGNNEEEQKLSPTKVIERAKSTESTSITGSKNNNDNKIYEIKRDLAGSLAIDSNGNTVARFNENISRDNNLKTGNLVKIKQYDTDKYFIEKVVNRSEKSDDIVIFGPAIVRTNSYDELCCNQETSGKYLSELNPLVHSFVINSKLADDFRIKDGDCISLAWHKAAPSIIKIRWRYETSDQQNDDSKSKTLKDNKEIVLLGKSYRSVLEAAELNNVNVQTLKLRILAFGKDDSRLFSQKHEDLFPRNATITICGTTYKNIHEAAKLHEINDATLRKRLLNKGLNNPSVFDNPIKK